MLLKDIPEIKKFLKRPDSISLEQEKELLQLICSNKMNAFVDMVVSLLTKEHALTTAEISEFNIYFYHRLESKKMFNRELQKQLATRLPYCSSLPVMGLTSPFVLRYLKYHNLLDEVIRSNYLGKKFFLIIH